VARANDTPVICFATTHILLDKKMTVLIRSRTLGT